MLRTGQLAERLGVSKRTVIEMAQSGHIPHFRLPSGHLRFDESAVLDALRAENGEDNATDN